MIGTKLGLRYELLSELGQGGMGVVYRAHDPVLHREVAVKLIPPARLSPESEQRFRSEAQIVAQMDHPSIVPIHDLGEHDGSLFFVMPVVEGTSLRAHLRDRSLSLGDIVELGVHVADALEYSHSRGVFHRDVKPENLMVSHEKGESLRVRVMDFGLARAQTDTAITKTGTLMGTMAYLSPEQVSGRPVDGRSDVYSLGTVLYECLAGTVPFSGELQSILYRIVHDLPVPPRQQGADVDDTMERIVMSCLHKDPARRPQTASELGDALRQYLATLRDDERHRTVEMSRTLAIPRPSLAPFVGRENELAELQGHLNAMLQGECHFVTVGGEPGVGKTRLLDELEELARARKVPVLHGRFLEQDRSFPYHAFCEVIQEFFRIRETSVSNLPERDLSEVAGDLVSLFPMLGEIAELRSNSGDARAALAAGARSPENRTEIYELLARGLAAVSGGKPLVLLLEDLHAADVSIEALQYVVRRLGPTPILVLGTYRSNDVDRAHPLTQLLSAFRGDRRFADLALSSLTPSEHVKLVEILVGGAGVEDGLSERIYEISEGNPFFTKEMVRSLLDSGGISRDITGSWNLAEGTGSSIGAMPTTIQEAVEKRIEQLPDTFRRALSVASVIGKVFDFRDLEALLPGEEDLEDAVDRLVQDGLIEEEAKSRGDRLAFCNGVIREVLYAGISRRRRRHLHREVGERIEKRHAGRLERVYAELVYHFSEGDVPEKTVEYGLELARRSLEAFSPEEAVHSAKTAVEFLEDDWEGDPAVEGQGRLLLARAHRMRGNTIAAVREVDRAIQVFTDQGKEEELTESLLAGSHMAWEGRRLKECVRYLDRGVAVARQQDATESLREFLSLSITLANLRGEYEQANRFLEELEALGPEDEDEPGRGEIPRGGRLVVALSNPAPAREPAPIRYDEEMEVLSNVFETLVGVDDHGNLGPLLAESWESPDDGWSFVLNLRQDVRFHDGSPLTAEDVKACFEHCVRTAPGDVPSALSAIEGSFDFRKNRAEKIEGIVVHSPHRLEIRLDEPLPIYPAVLTHGGTAVAKRADDGGNDTPWTLGTGPFRLADPKDGRIVLERNESWWRGEPARLDALEFVPGMSGAAIVEGLRSGEIDVGRNFTSEELEQLLKDARFRGRLVEIPGSNTFFALFNTRTGPAAREPRLRRALCSVVRARDLVWRTRGRISEPAACLIPPGFLGNDAGRRRRTLTREQADRLLRETEITRPVTLRATVSPAIQDRMASVLEALFARWREIGVGVEIVTETPESFTEKLADPDTIDLHIGGWSTDYHDPDTITHGLFDSRIGVYRRFFCSPETDEILARARSETRPEQREALYRQFESVLEESGVLLPLFHGVEHRLPAPCARGLRLTNRPPYTNYNEIGKTEGTAPVPEVGELHGGIVRIPILGNLTESLDPALISFVNEAEVSSTLFETLTRAMGARIVPWLASDVRAEDGGRRYRFRLREGVRFHDGHSLSARDVRWTFERFLSGAGRENRWILWPIHGAAEVADGSAETLEGFRIHSTHEFTLELEQPTAFFPAALSNQVVAILPEGVDPSGDTPAKECAGTGPFRLVRFEPQKRIELERNPSYWRRGFPKTQGLVFATAPNSEDIKGGFLEGRYSLAESLPAADVQELRRNPKYASCYHESPSLQVLYLALQKNSGPLADAALRRRLVRAVDREAIARALRSSGGAASGLIPPGLLGHDPVPGSHGLEEVDATLSNGGQLPDLTLSTACTRAFRSSRPELMREIEQSLTRIGVRIRFVTESMDDLNRVVLQGEADLVIAGWGAEFPDTHAILHGLVHSEGLLGKICGTPETDALIERALGETGSANRHSLYREVEEILRGEALIVPLQHLQIYRFCQPEIDGLELSYTTPFVSYDTLRIAP